MKNCLFVSTAVALLWSSLVLAIPLTNLEYRQVQTTEALTPWVTVESSTPKATITPVLTTIGGTPTTLDPAPTTATPTSIGVIPDGTVALSSPTTAAGSGAFDVCQNLSGEHAPLCQMPNNNTLYISETYYVTWDTNYYTTPNATVRVMLNYNNATGGGPQAWESEETLNSWGFVSLTIEKAWLQGSSSNNLTLYITSLGTAAQGSHETESRPGPTITITSRPYQPYTPPPPTKAPTGQSLYIALPTVAVFVLLVVCGGCFINRKHRQIGLGNIMGRNRGYRPGNKGARRQRLGLGKKGNIELRDQELRTGPGVYRDVPANWTEDDPFTDKPSSVTGINIPRTRPSLMRSSSEGLEILVDTPTIERGRDRSWDSGFPVDRTPTRTKSVGDRGFVKEEVQIIERHASGGPKLPVMK